MNDFLDKLQKIRSGYFSRMRLLFLLDLISFFCVSYAIFIILHLAYFLEKSSLYLSVRIDIIPPSLAFIIAIICALLLHRKDSKINLMLLIENKYSELKEKLRTAYDNRAETNAIVESLKSNVSEVLDKVSSSHLIARGLVISKIIVAVMFISAATTVSSDPERFSIPVETIANISNTLQESLGDVANETLVVIGQPEADDKVGKTGGGDIFGKPNIAPIEGKPVDLSLEMGLGTGYVPSEYTPDKNLFFKSAAFPVGVLGSNVSDGGYGIIMKKTEAEKKLIEDYAVKRS
ncbi:MAG: hypothetical protein Q8O41_09145 [Candidatus Methanoperedens sp.]|nr:hypothetical protein [Candidatus Methanoperedens sp.]